MANHPNRNRTYWHLSPRGFGNEYTVAIATSREAAQSYEDRGYDRVDRQYALKELTYRGDAATKAYVSAEIDGRQVDDRFELARAIRTGSPLPRTYSY
jgi:hypothetical protein